MRKTILMIALSSAFLGATAMAQDDYSARTEVEEQEVSRGILKDEKFAIRPQAGVLVYTDSAGDTNSRLAAGLTLDWNVAQTFAANEMKDWFMGPSTGVIYSHLGNKDADFLGSSSASQNAGANFFYIPINLKVGYNVANNFRVSAHGGGNLTYRSEADAVRIGTDATAKTKIFPNVGADLEWGLGSIALGLRPDVTLGTEKSLFSGTMTVAIPLA